MGKLLEAQIQSRFGAQSESRLAVLCGLPDAALHQLAWKIPTATTLVDLGLPAE